MAWARHRGRWRRFRGLGGQIALYRLETFEPLGFFYSPDELLEFMDAHPHAGGHSDTNVTVQIKGGVFGRGVGRGLTRREERQLVAMSRAKERELDR